LSFSYEKNVGKLSSNKRISKASLNNIAIQLRKVCAHPFLLPGVEQEVCETAHTEAEKLKMMVDSCGKLILLDKVFF